MKLFYNAFNYNLVTGIFDNTNLKYTPYNLYLSRKYLFEGNKIIVPIEFEKEIELQEYLESFLRDKYSDGTKFIIQRIELSKFGNGMEPFLEYLCSEYFKNSGYIVETQIPLSYSEGTPDFGGYILHKFKDFVKGAGLPLNNIHMIELAMIRIKMESGTYKSTNYNLEDYFIVGEAKAYNTEMKKQLKRYLKTGIFNEGYQIHPHEVNTIPNVGSFYIDKDYKINVKQPDREKILVNQKKQLEYSNWLSNYIKYYLISNLTNDELYDFYHQKRNKKISCKEDIINFVNNLTYEDIFLKIKEVSNGPIKR